MQRQRYNLVDGDTESLDVEFAITWPAAATSAWSTSCSPTPGVTVDCDPGTHGDQPLPSTLAVDAEVDWSEW